KTLIPAAMPRHLFPMQLKIIFFTATELPEMMTDFLATVSKKILQSHAWEPVDPYVEVTYDTMTVATEARNGTTPIWGEALYLIGRFPPLVRTIKITLKDRASVQKDRIISSIFIDLFLISESNPSIGFLPTLGPTWIFLYGSPREYTISKDKDGLSEGMGEAVCYKGRILMAIESHPVTTENTPNMNIQKETDIKFPEAHIFPKKRSFLLFGCIYDVSMINKSFGNGTISFELSIGPSGYLNPQKLVAAIHKPVSSLTRTYQHVSIDNNKDYFRLPIDLQKPILFTKYIFHDYIYRMTLSNRLKNASAYLYEQICEFELKIDSKISNEILIEEYRKIQYYIHTLPCGCAEHIKEREIFGTTPVVHSNLYELLNSSQSTLKMNQLDIKRFKKILNNIQSIKTWISKEINFDVSQRYKIIEELHKIARAFQQMATDAQPSLPDIFLWMICDSKRVAYARFQPEDLLFNLCKGEKGLYNGRVQTIFLKTPRSTDKPLNPSTNAKVQIYLWLGIEDHEPSIFKHLPAGFNMPPLPLHPQLKFITYNERTFYELRCHCYKARALITADATGLSDPYLSVTVGNETQTAPILLESLCPQWNVTLAFQNLVHVGSRETAEEIIGNVVVECYDYDEVRRQSYEFDVQLPFQSLIRIQLWDWDMTSFNDMIGETKIDIENRWFSFHRATCGLPKRYDSAGYNTWRDTKKPTIILTELCRTTHINVPVYMADFRSVTVGDKIFECDPECVEFVMDTKSSVDILYRKAYHESTDEYIRQNTALAALHTWGRKIDQKCALVTEHIECRSLFNPEFPGIEQGKLEMWLDFFPMSRPPSNAMVDITPPKPTSYQLRIIIWNTTDIELNDENFLTGEKTSDIYVTAWILGERVDAQQTDIHYRSLTGDGNFNWRFLFDFDYLDIEEKIVFQAKDSVFQVGNTTKKIPPKIIIRVYDADFFSADDFLGECVLNLTHVPLGTKVPNKCKADILLNPKHRAINLFANKRIAGWWPMIAPLKEGEIRDKTLLGGKFEAEFSLVTAEEAEKNPVGKAREPPQPLEKPSRPTTSFLWFTSPWKTLRYVVWRNFKWAIILGVLIFIGVIFLLLAIWTIPGEIVSQVATKIFKNK
ncbi:unnamed protein product, partial [Rotaria sordida]